MCITNSSMSLLSLSPLSCILFWDQQSPYGGAFPGAAPGGSVFQFFSNKQLLDCHASSIGKRLFTICYFLCSFNQKIFVFVRLLLCLLMPLKCSFRLIKNINKRGRSSTLECAWLSHKLIFKIWNRPRHFATRRYGRRIILLSSKQSNRKSRGV